MDDVRLGRVIRALRIRRAWRQEDLARRAGVSRALVSLVERGHLRHTTLATVHAVARELEATIDANIRWRGGDVDRLLNAGHARLHEHVAVFLDRLGGWQYAPEVSFSIYGERGVIDILAFHGPSASILILELKTEIASLEDLLTTIDRRTRLGFRIAAERGWRAHTVSAWVVVAASEANRRRIARHRATIRSAFPADGREMRAWLRHPSGTIRALSTWADDTGNSATGSIAPRQRVRRPRHTRDERGRAQAAGR